MGLCIIESIVGDSTMRIWIGRSLIVIGLIHSIFGLVTFHKIVADLAREMLLNTISSQLDRHAAFWFLFTGFSLIIIGGLIDWIERRNLGMPSFLKWSFLFLTVLGCIIMPKSGFWLLLIPTVGLYLRRNGGYTKASQKN